MSLKISQLFALRGREKKICPCVHSKKIQFVCGVCIQKKTDLISSGNQAGYGVFEFKKSGFGVFCVELGLCSTDLPYFLRRTHGNTVWQRTSKLFVITLNIVKRQTCAAKKIDILYVVAVRKTVCTLYSSCCVI